MKLSIIIPTYNEEDVILDCLNSLFTKQLFTDFEVIVVDDGSSDRTLEKIKTEKNQNLVILSQSHKGAGSARNFGAKHALGEILVFVDSDMTFDKNFLKMLVRPILSGKSKGTFSKDELVSNWENVWARCWNINEGWMTRKRHPKNYPDTQPVFRAILKSEFVRVGGFTPGGYDDDWSLSKKLRYEATVAKGAVFYHKNPESLLEVFNHAKWAGKRRYKFGVFGILFGLLRVSLPVSILIGIYKSTISKQSLFLVFKIIYDLGVFTGIIDYLITQKGSK